MHALLMSYVINLPLDQLRPSLERYAQALTATDGLVMKTWLIDDSVVGGFYLFDNRYSAEAFMRGAVCEEIVSDSAFSHFRISLFEVLDDLSAITNSPSADASTRPERPELITSP